MKVMTMLVGVAAGLLISSACNPQEVPPRPSELNVLDNFAGTWDSEIVGKPAEWTPQGVKSKGANKYEWVLGRRFMQNTALVLGWWTYDTSAKSYRGWFFLSDGNMVEWKGRWDAEAKGLRMEANLGNGVVFTGVNRFPDKNTYEWTLVAKDETGKVYLDMKEMHRRRSSSGKAFSLEKPKEDKNAEGPPKPPELKVLERYLGNWNSETVSKVAEWNPKETRITGTVTNEWVLDGRFIQMRGKSSTGAESIQLGTFDLQKKQYRAWVFDSTGTAANADGQWDEDAKTLTWKGDLGKGVTANNAVRFVGTDTIEWRMVARNGEGKRFLNMEGKFSRRK